MSERIKQALIDGKHTSPDGTYVQISMDALMSIVGAPQALQVWCGPMPESNGKSNFTAILHKGDLVDGHTITRSEYPDRVRYEADRVRFLIGELPESPDILAYDADKHSGYIYPDTTCGVVCQAAKDDGVCCADDECDRENGVRPAAPPVRSAATSESASTLQALADRLRWISMQNLSLKLLDEVWRNLPDIVRGLDAAAASARNDRNHEAG